ncbi:MAG: hypothetical protein GEU83_19120 [Pseudonocardiaceae bacterium]|nr:hypothetical protein [Pseudonocardiaceae bacterium]
MSTDGGLPAFAGLRLIEDRYPVQRYDAVDAEGRPLTVLVLSAQASADPQQRSMFAAQVTQATVATLPGQLPISYEVAAPRPWAVSFRHPAAAGVERLLPLMEAAHRAQQPTGPPPAGLPPSQPTGAPSPSQIWAPPQDAATARSSAPLFAALGAVALLLVIGLVTVLGMRGSEEPAATAPPPTPQLPPPTLGTPTPEPPPQGPRPQLEDVPPVTVLGPSFAPDDDTYTMDFRGWPFAFRTPGTWGCLKASAPIPDADGWGCIDERNPDGGQRATVMVRPCPSTCTAAEQREMNQVWFDEPERAVSSDPTTSYVETRRTDSDTYSVDASHFFAEEPGEPLSWQVGVYVESPFETRDEVLKILNDVRSQTR